MKWVGYILVIAIIIALFTSPSEKKFEKFISGKADTTACKPLISHKSYGIFSLGIFSISTVRKCQKINPAKSVRVLKNAGIAVYGEEEAYLGLFGKFWKL